MAFACAYDICKEERVVHGPRCRPPRPGDPDQAVEPGPRRACEFDRTRECIRPPPEARPADRVLHSRRRAVPNAAGVQRLRGPRGRLHISTARTPRRANTRSRVWIPSFSARFASTTSCARSSGPTGWIRRLSYYTAITRRQSLRAASSALQRSNPSRTLSMQVCHLRMSCATTSAQIVCRSAHSKVWQAAQCFHELRCCSCSDRR